jgi:activator of HSP90 ATPase
MFYGAVFFTLSVYMSTDNTNNDEVTSLIRQLKDLRVEESRLVTALEQAHSRTLLEKQQKKQQQQQKEHSADKTTKTTKTTATSSRTNHSPQPGIFVSGDTVLITNKIKPRSDRAINSGDRTAVVTSVTADRVFFRTLNGTNTWRAPGNLKHANR